MITLRSAAMRGLIKFVLIATCACATTQEPADKPSKTVSSRRAKRAPKPAIPDNLTSSEDLAPSDDVAAPEGEVLGQGMASFYADSLAGNRTASGEKYRPDSRTCAHRTLPFGTKLKLVAVKSGKTSSCRVNDRGPFVSGRILDVSKIVARELGMVDSGVAEVRIESAGDGDT
jgi:rare lipoprotein A